MSDLPDRDVDIPGSAGKWNGWEMSCTSDRGTAFVRYATQFVVMQDARSVPRAKVCRFQRKSRRGPDRPLRCEEGNGRRRASQTSLAQRLPGSAREAKSDRVPSRRMRHPPPPLFPCAETRTAPAGAGAADPLRGTPPDRGPEGRDRPGGRLEDLCGILPEGDLDPLWGLVAPGMAPPPRGRTRSRHCCLPLITGTWMHPRRPQNDPGEKSSFPGSERWADAPARAGAAGEAGAALPGQTRSAAGGGGAAVALRPPPGRAPRVRARPAGPAASGRTRPDGRAETA